MASRADARYTISAEDRTRRAFESVQKSIKETNDALRKLGRSFIAFAGISTISDITRDVIELGAELSQLSTQYGADVDFLSRMQFAARQAGISFDSVTDALGTLQEKAVEAARGNQAYAETFQGIGVDAAKLAESRPEQIFLTMADAMARIENPAERVQRALELMDDSGTELLRIMSDGSEGLQQLWQDAENAGAGISAEQAQRLAEVRAEFINLQTQIESIVRELVVSVSPQLIQITQGLAQMIAMLVDEYRPAIQAFFDDLSKNIGELSPEMLAFVKDTLGMIKSITDVMITIGKAVSWITDVMADIAAVAAELFTSARTGQPGPIQEAIEATRRAQEMERRLFERDISGEAPLHRQEAPSGPPVPFGTPGTTNAPRAIELRPSEESVEQLQRDIEGLTPGAIHAPLSLELQPELMMPEMPVIDVPPLEMQIPEIPPELIRPLQAVQVPPPQVVPPEAVQVPPAQVASPEATIAPSPVIMPPEAIQIPPPQVISQESVRMPPIQVVQPELSEIQMPSVQVPPIEIPHIDIPSIDPIEFQVPAATMPAIDPIVLDTPRIDIPSIENLSIKAPEIDIPPVSPFVAPMGSFEVPPIVSGDTQISNIEDRAMNVTNNFGDIVVSGAKLDMSETATRRWVRNELIPEIEAATR